MDPEDAGPSGIKEAPYIAAGNQHLGTGTMLVGPAYLRDWISGIWMRVRRMNYYFNFNFTFFPTIQVFMPPPQPPTPGSAPRRSRSC